MSVNSRERILRHFRFNIASLLFVVLVLAVGIAALRESNEIWDAGVFTLTLGVLLVSIILAVHRRKARRAFWLGFGLFGFGYLVLTLVPTIESRLLATKGLAYLDSKVPGRTHNQVRAVAFSPQGKRLATSSLGTVKVWDARTGRLLGGRAGTTENFVRIGHSLFALVAAWLGGLLSCRLWRVSRHPDVSSVA